MGNPDQFSGFPLDISKPLALNSCFADLRTPIVRRESVARPRSLENMRRLL